MNHFRQLAHFETVTIQAHITLRMWLQIHFEIFIPQLYIWEPFFISSTNCNPGPKLVKMVLLAIMILSIQNLPLSIFLLCRRTRYLDVVITS